MPTQNVRYASPGVQPEAQSPPGAAHGGGCSSSATASAIAAVPPLVIGMGDQLAQGGAPSSSCDAGGRGVDVSRADDDGGATSCSSPGLPLSPTSSTISSHPLADVGHEIGQVGTLAI